MVLGDLLDTAITIFRTGSGGLSNLLNVVQGDDDTYQELRECPFDHDRFVLIFSHLDEPTDFENLPDFRSIFIGPSTPIMIGPLLSMLASVVVVHEDITGLEFQVQQAMQIAASRNIPVIDVGSAFEDVSLPFLECHVTHRIASFADLAPAMSDLAPTSKFPFSMTPEDSGSGNWQFNPAAPMDFVTDAPPGTPRHQVVLNRMFMMIRRGQETHKIIAGDRYFACFVGDLCVAIEDSSHRTLVSMLRNSAL